MAQVETLTTMAGFRKAIGASVCVIDFSATWCGPCKAIAPRYHGLAQEFPAIRFCKVDVDEAQDISEYCNVRSLPTFTIYVDGTLRDTIVGADYARLSAAVRAVAPLARPQTSFSSSSGRALGGSSGGIGVSNLLSSGTSASPTGLTTTTGSSTSSSAAVGSAADQREIEGIVRTLLENLKSGGEECVQIVSQLVSNAIQNPREPRYRRVRRQNAQIREKIVGVRGGIELLHYLGWRDVDGDTLALSDAALRELSRRGQEFKTVWERTEKARTEQFTRTVQAKAEGERQRDSAAEEKRLLREQERQQLEERMRQRGEQRQLERQAMLEQARLENDARKRQTSTSSIKTWALRLILFAVVVVWLAQVWKFRTLPAYYEGPRGGEPDASAEPG